MLFRAFGTSQYRQAVQNISFISEAELSPTDTELEGKQGETIDRKLVA